MKTEKTDRFPKRGVVKYNAVLLTMMIEYKDVSIGFGLRPTTDGKQMERLIAKNLAGKVVMKHNVFKVLHEIGIN